MYIAHGAKSGVLSLNSEQKFLYYWLEVDLPCKKDYQVLTSEVPNIYSWRPFVMHSGHNIKYDAACIEDNTKMCSFMGASALRKEEKSIIIHF